MKKSKIIFIIFFINTKDNIKNNDNSNNSDMCTSLNRELSYNSKFSEPPQSSSGAIRKNIQTGGGEKKLKISKKYNSNYLKFGFDQEPGSDLHLRPLCVVCSEILSNDCYETFKT